MVLNRENKEQIIFSYNNGLRFFMAIKYTKTLIFVCFYNKH